MASVTRRERLREQGRREILEAAMALFAERGFHDVSMQEIAKRAGCAVGTLYSAFDNKQDLFSALIADCVNQTAHVILPILDDPLSGPRQKMDRLIAIHRHIVAQNAPYIRLYLSQVQMPDLPAGVGMGPDAAAAATLIHDRLTSVLEAGMRQGMFRCTDAALTAHLLISMLRGLAFAAIREPDKVTPERVGQVLESLMFHGLLKETDHA